MMRKADTRGLFNALRFPRYSSLISVVGEFDTLLWRNPPDFVWRASYHLNTGRVSQQQHGQQPRIIGFIRDPSTPSCFNFQRAREFGRGPYRLTGRAEATRLAFYIGGVNFEDKRISFPEFPELRPKTPFFALPTLEVEGEIYGQSTALLRYAGKLSNLYPDDALTALKVDEIVMAGEDAIILLFGTLKLDAETAKSKRAELADGSLKELLERIEAKLKANSSPYFVGDSITIADLQVFTMVGIIKSGFVAGIPTDLVSKVTPAIEAHHETVSKHPKVAAYYAEKKG